MFRDFFICQILSVIAGYFLFLPPVCQLSGCLMDVAGVAQLVRASDS
jgi:hypothetical protein